MPSLSRPPIVAPWGSRIVGRGTQRAGQLLAHPSNWRTHGFAQEAALTSVLHDIGWVQSVIVNKRTDPSWGRDRGVETVLDGHLRIKAALARDEEQEIPVVYVDLLPAEERRILATLDPIGAMAGRDDEVLASLAESVITEWPEIDLAAILHHEPRAKRKGLTHDVQECQCCKAGCRPGCGCYREEP